MTQQNEKIVFTTEDNEEIEFFVLEQTKVNGITYILVADADNGEEANALILKDISEEEAEEAVYDVVEDEEELSVISRVFVEMMDDIDIVME